MGDSWRYRPIQSNICPICSTSHFPFCPPPPAFAYAAADDRRRLGLNPPPSLRLIHRPPFLDHRFAPPLTVSDPNPNQVPPFHPSNRFPQDEFSDHDGYRKRMRFEDPNQLPPPRISVDDEWRLNMIREHGRQDAASIAHNDFNHNFHELSRPRGIERQDFYGGEVEKVRNVGSWIRSEENYIGRVSDERPYVDIRPSVAHDRQSQFYPTESSSYYTLPKQPRYPQPENYHMMPKRGRDEQGSHYPPPDPSLRPPLENKMNPFEHKPPYFEETRKPYEPHVGTMGYGSNDYRMDSTMSVRVHASQTYPPMPPLGEEQERHYHPPYRSLRVPSENTMEQQRPPAFEGPSKPFEPHANSMPYGSNGCTMDPAVMDRLHTSQKYHHLPLHPPLPLLPPPPEPSPPPYSQVKPLSPDPAFTSAHLFPTTPNSHSSLGSRLGVQSNFHNGTSDHTSTGFVTKGLRFIHQTPANEYMEREAETFPPRHSFKDKPTFVNACHLFRQPHRASRPGHIVIIFRGLPGSGKSYLAKALRDLEVESGGNAPRIHAMDDYFMIEVEKKVEENDGLKSSGSSRGKKQITKKVIEYCYEPEMEEAYRSSMLKAFKKTIDEGSFTFIIVDDRNLRVADFAQFWAIAKRSGYEVYLLEATYKDPTGCAARNVHGFSVEDIQKMAEQWEDAPSLYLQLDIQSLFSGDNLNEQSIQEVDMDMDDAGCDEETLKRQQSQELKITESNSLNHILGVGDALKIGERWNADDDEEEEPTRMKDLGSSKWSKDIDEDIGNSDTARGNVGALSGLIQAYGKSEKSVHWGDQVEQSGFSILAVKKQNRSLIIGPGGGYNLNSNPIQEDEDALKPSVKNNMNESNRRFTEQLRAERESFKAVFEKRRRQRIGGLWDAEDE